MGSKNNPDGLRAQDREEKLKNLQLLSDPKSPIWKGLEGLDANEIAKELGFKDLDAQILVGDKLTSIRTFIPNAPKKEVKASDSINTDKYTNK